jgi:hypothetical protein
MPHRADHPGTGRRAALRQVGAQFHAVGPALPRRMRGCNPIDAYFQSHRTLLRCGPPAPSLNRLMANRGARPPDQDRQDGSRTSAGGQGFLPLAGGFPWFILPPTLTYMKTVVRRVVCGLSLAAPLAFLCFLCVHSTRMARPPGVAGDTRSSQAMVEPAASRPTVDGFLVDAGRALPVADDKPA